MRKNKKLSREKLDRLRWDEASVYQLSLDQQLHIEQISNPQSIFIYKINYIKSVLMTSNPGLTWAEAGRVTMADLELIAPGLFIGGIDDRS